MLFDISNLIETVGLIGIFIIVFAESGLFFGFFLPGDSLLFMAGILSSQGFLNLQLLLILTFIGAVTGDSFGYAFGRKVGPKIFTKENSLFFKKHYVVVAQNFYKKYGGKTIIIARFIPIVRTFAPILAGVGNMNYRKFILFNIIGGLLWSVSLILAGFYFGNAIPDIEKYLLPMIALIILISILPPAVHILKDSRHRYQILRFLKLKK